MTANSHSSLALIVGSPPYQNRVARADIDIALAAAALDFEVHVYFLGHAIFQLAADRKTTDAMLPVGYRAWASLPDLAEARVYAEQQWLEFCKKSRLELVMQVEALSPARMKLAWRSCLHVLVL